jgi:hypothetical protein
VYTTARVGPKIFCVVMMAFWQKSTERRRQVPVRNGGTSEEERQDEHHFTFVRRSLLPCDFSPKERYINAGLDSDKLDQSRVFEHDEQFLSLWATCVHSTRYVYHIAGSDETKERRVIDIPGFRKRVCPEWL